MMSVLLVEDEAISRRLVAKGLTRLGYRVQAAADGLEALPLLHQKWDFIITDLIMPRMDGLDLLVQIQEHCPQAQRIVITSFADKDKVIRVLNLGADYLLEKPFGVDRLHDIMQRLNSDRSEQGGDITQFFQKRLQGLPLAEREKEIVALLLKGHTNHAIAQATGLGEQTIKNTLSTIYARLGISSRTELFHAIFPL